MPDSASPSATHLRRSSKRTLIISLCALVGLPLLGIGILMPSLCRAREPANRVKCASNERPIGQALLLYAKEHAGHYPDSLPELLLTQDITPEVFVCPSSNGEKAQGDTAE